MLHLLWLIIFQRLQYLRTLKPSAGGAPDVACTGRVLGSSRAWSNKLFHSVYELILLSEKDKTLTCSSACHLKLFYRQNTLHSLEVECMAHLAEGLSNDDLYFSSFMHRLDSWFCARTSVGEGLHSCAHPVGSKLRPRPGQLNHTYTSPC